MCRCREPLTRAKGMVPRRGARGPWRTTARRPRTSSPCEWTPPSAVATGTRLPASTCQPNPRSHCHPPLPSPTVSRTLGHTGTPQLPASTANIHRHAFGCGPTARRRYEGGGLQRRVQLLHTPSSTRFVRDGLFAQARPATQLTRETMQVASARSGRYGCTKLLKILNSDFQEPKKNRSGPLNWQPLPRRAPREASAPPWPCWCRRPRSRSWRALLRAGRSRSVSAPSPAAQ